MPFGRVLASVLAPVISPTQKQKTKLKEEANVVDLNVIKITPRDEDVLRLLGQGCSNKEIARQLNISPRTVKQHLRTLFLRAGIKQGRKRVILATAVYEKEQLCNRREIA